MAQSPAHKFGQIVGDVLELAIEPLLRRFADEHGLYLDRRGPRSCRRGNKVRWTDRYQNSHDLDFVLERGGSPTTQGIPVAFIETAWRRYTKHSRNKAQEIQGAILPLAETFSDSRPFMGAVLAGVFTAGALNQLHSLGFNILHFPYSTVLVAFAEVGIDAAFDEATADAEFERKVSAWEALSATERTHLAESLVRLNASEVAEFLAGLTRAVTRQIADIRILSLHGEAVICKTVDEAVNLIERYELAHSIQIPFVRFEIRVTYANGDHIDGYFVTKDGAVEFLSRFR